MKRVYICLAILITIPSVILPKISERSLEKMKLFYKDLPVTVTGGAGFIGSYIVEKLVDLGANVTVVDNLSSGVLENLSRVKHSIRFIQKDIENLDDCITATKGAAVIFHLAAFISVPDSISNPDLCHRTNIDGTFNILEAARINNVERLVFSSSAAIYGPTTDICTEHMPYNPQSPYGTSKAIGELLCKQYATNFDLKTVILRYFNVFGARQNPNGAYAAVVAKFSELMKQNKPLTIFGDGLQTRDFIPVEEVARANIVVAMLPENQMNGQVFNIGTGKSINLFELIDMLKKKYPSYSSNIYLKPARIGDIKHSAADCSKYQNITI